MRLMIIFLLWGQSIGFHTVIKNQFTRLSPPWHPGSWQSKETHQLPSYPNPMDLQECQDQLRASSPLVFAGECRELRNEIARVACGRAFLLLGGDCAESFDDFSVDSVRDTYKLLLQMAIILTYSTSLPVIKVARMGGQYAKPRSQEFETIENVTLPIYRGDSINDSNFTLYDRTPDPRRMLTAYHLSAQTLNIMRAFSSGGFADLNRLDLHFLNDSQLSLAYHETIARIQQCLRFIRAIGIHPDNPIFRTTKMYTAHECLLLPYEECLTRQDSISQQWYDCSAHLLWIGERTRQLNGSHIEFLRGINNPIGIKISHQFDPAEILDMINILNPHNELGRLIIMTRMGANHLKTRLPELISLIQNNSLHVAWCCDPMHGNTFTIRTRDGRRIKTRSLQDIMNEINVYLEIHQRHGTHPGGLHLELTGLNVTECIGGDIVQIQPHDLPQYKSKCDPRLNALQSLDIALNINLLEKKKSLIYKKDEKRTF